MRPTLLPFLGLLVSLAACDGLFEGREIVHPIADSIAAPPQLAVFVGRGAPESGPAMASLRDFAERLALARPLLTVGELNGPTEYVLGRVLDAKLSTRRELFVLDRQTSGISVYDSLGVFQYQIGRHGEGPGEFNLPVRFFFRGADSLMVIDMWRQIHRYARTGNRMEYVDRLELDAWIRDVCPISDGWVVHVASAGGAEVLHRYDLHSSLRLRFAQPYRYSRPLVADRVNKAKIACAPDDDLVFLAPLLQDRVEAYNFRSGELKWHAKLEGLSPGRIVETDGGHKVTTGIFDDPYFHLLIGIATSQRNPLVVQYGRVSREDYLQGTGQYTVETFVLDRSTGRGIYLGEDVPQVLSLGDETVVFLRTGLYPKVEVREFR